MTEADIATEYNDCVARLLRNPNDPQALVDMFACLTNNGSGEDCGHYLILARRAYHIAPQEVNVVFNYASALGRVGRHEDAIPLYQKAFDLGDPNWKARCLYHIGIALRGAGRDEEAIKYYRTAVELDPNDFQAKQDIALATLACGRLCEGLEMFEVRHDLAKLRMEKKGHGPSAHHLLPKTARHWQGEDLTDKTVTVYHEEGQGDFIQFCRFIPRLKAAGIYLAGPANDLLEMVSDQIKVDGIVPLEGPIGTDYVVGSMTVPWRTGVEYGDVPGAAYFLAEPANIPRRGQLNVGLVWRGSPDFARDAQRSMKFEELCPLFDIPNAAFYSLQKGEASSEIGKLGFDGFVADLDCFLTDWRATARVIAALDVVVTVDTAVAHLAGALGKPAIVMVTQCCDWRWNRSSERTIWYDSARIIRQQQQDHWAPCVERARELLKAM